MTQPFMYRCNYCDKLYIEQAEAIKVVHGIYSYEKAIPVCPFCGREIAVDYEDTLPYDELFEIVEGLKYYHLKKMAKGLKKGSVKLGWILQEKQGENHT